MLNGSPLFPWFENIGIGKLPYPFDGILQGIKPSEFGIYEHTFEHGIEKSGFGIANNAIRPEIIAELEEFLPIGRNERIVIYPVGNIDNVLTVVIVEAQ